MPATTPLHETSGLPKSQRKVPARRRILFALIVALLTYAAVEGLAALLIVFRYGSFGSVWRERDIAAATDSATSTNALDDDSVQTFLGEKVRPDLIHPYNGFVRQPPPPGSDKLQHEANAYGFNDPELPIRRRAPDKVIVGIVGGSVAEQFAQHACDALAAELSQSPKFAGRRFEFVRLALRGHKQPQQLMTINYLLTLGAEFDVLINLDGFNEVALPNAENAPDHVAPSFPRKWHARIANLRNPDVSKLLGYSAYLKTEQQRRAQAFAGTPWRVSPLATLIWKVSADSQSREIIAVQTQLDELARNESAYGATGPQTEFDSPEQFDRQCVDIWSRSSQLLNQICAANGIAYFHFLQPNQYVEGSKPMNAAEQAVALNVENPYREHAIRCYPLLAREGEALRQTGIRFHDLTRAFAEHTEPLYVDDCCHFNEQGDAILAREIAAIIRNEFAKAEHNQESTIKR